MNASCAPCGSGHSHVCDRVRTTVASIGLPGITITILLLRRLKGSTGDAVHFAQVAVDGEGEVLPVAWFGPEGLAAFPLEPIGTDIGQHARLYLSDVPQRLLCGD